MRHLYVRGGNGYGVCVHACARVCICVRTRARMRVERGGGGVGLLIFTKENGPSKGQTLWFHPVHNITAQYQS